MQRAMMSSRIVVLIVVLIAALTAGCQLGLDGARCPCAVGWSCCPGADRCARDLASCPGSDAGSAPPTGMPPGSPVAPVAGPGYQGGQSQFRTATGAACHGRVAAGLSSWGFCFLAANDDVVCAGRIGDVDHGKAFTPIGQTAATQIMVMFLDNGMCVARADHTVQCMGSNTNAFGPSAISAAFQPWIERSDIAAIATASWDQLCGISLTGQVFCGGLPFGYPPVPVGGPGQTRVWVGDDGSAHLSDAVVVRPGESYVTCRIESRGLVCEPRHGDGEVVVPGNAPVVTGLEVSDTANFEFRACWLTEDATVTCTFGPRFAPGQVLWFTASYYSDSMCAIYRDGSVWCIGSNTYGKLGTGDTQPLLVETMVAPPGSARVACDP